MASTAKITVVLTSDEYRFLREEMEVQCANLKDLSRGGPPREKSGLRERYTKLDNLIKERL